MMLTENVSYKLNIDYAGEYEDGGKLLPVLALRLYIERDVANPEKKFGVNINSEGANKYDSAVETISGKIDRWFKKKYEEDVDSSSWLLGNDGVRDAFARLAKCSSRSFRGLRTKTVQG